MVSTLHGSLQSSLSLALQQKEQEDDANSDSIDSKGHKGVVGNEFQKRLDADHGEDEGGYEADKNILPVPQIEN